MDSAKARQLCEESLNTLYIKRDLGRLGDFYAADVISHPAQPGVPPGIKGLEQMTRAFLDAFSDISYRIESFTQDGENHSCKLVTTGTHTGTGKKMELVNQVRYRIANGKIAEFWNDAAS